MPRFTRFTFLVNDEERLIIAGLAKRLQRSQSDAIRWVVINAASELERQVSSVSDNQTHSARQEKVGDATQQ